MAGRKLGAALITANISKVVGFDQQWIDNTFFFSAHLGALHIEGGQLSAVGVLLERGAEVKVDGPHPKVGGLTVFTFLTYF